MNTVDLTSGQDHGLRLADTARRGRLIVGYQVLLAQESARAAGLAPRVLTAKEQRLVDAVLGAEAARAS